ncbi:MAG TPA: ABC transporter substrate-binding protein [Burkholderiales bacterium]|nr:ABC transporter substrate-binding protein [Burkholderiales bacterium]
MSSLENLRARLAPTGTLRAGLNRSNFLLVAKDSPDDAPRGVAVDMAREIARRAELPVMFVCYESPGKMADAIKTGAWDIAFFAVEPARAGEIDFTTAYVEIEATYLVPAGSPLKTLADVDRPGVRISVSGRSAYDLYLTRNLKHAELLRADGIDASYERFVAEKLDALAGLRPKLVDEVAKLPGAKILEGRFTAIQQAIGVPKGKTGVAQWLQQFVDEVKASGFVAELIERHGARGLTVAPKS